MGFKAGIYFKESNFEVIYMHVPRKKQSSTQSVVSKIALRCTNMLLKYVLLRHVANFVFSLVFKLDGTDMIKELYKRMDPTVTQPDSGDIKGDVQLSLKYNHKQELLLVKVIRARDLVPRDLNGKSDPYAVLDLVPDL